MFMRAGMLAFCLGVWLFSRVPVLPPWQPVAIVCLLLLLAAAMLAVLCRQSTSRSRALLLFCLSAALGMAWAWLLAARHVEQLLPRELELALALRCLHHGCASSLEFAIQVRHGRPHFAARMPKKN